MRWSILVDREDIINSHIPHICLSTVVPASYKPCAYINASLKCRAPCDDGHSHNASVVTDILDSLEICETQNDFILTIHEKLVTADPWADPWARTLWFTPGDPHTFGRRYLSPVLHIERNDRDAVVYRRTETSRDSD